MSGNERINSNTRDQGPTPGQVRRNQRRRRGRSTKFEQTSTTGEGFRTDALVIELGETGQVYVMDWETGRPIIEDVTSWTIEGAEGVMVESPSPQVIRAAEDRNRTAVAFVESVTDAPLRAFVRSETTAVVMLSLAHG